MNLPWSVHLADIGPRLFELLTPVVDRGMMNIDQGLVMVKMNL